MAAKRTERRRAAPHPTAAQIDAWVEAALAAARAEGRELPDAAVSPDDDDATFLGALNAIGRRPALERYRHCMSCAAEAFRRGDCRGAGNAICTACSLLPREGDEGGTFGSFGLDEMLFDIIDAAMNCARDGKAAGGALLLDGLAETLRCVDEHGDKAAIVQGERYLANRDAAQGGA